MLQHCPQKSRTSPVSAMAETGHFGRRCLETLSRCGNGIPSSHSKSSSMDVINEDASNSRYPFSLGSPTLLEDEGGARYAESFRNRASTDGSLKYRKRPETSSQPVSPPVATDPGQLTFNSSGRRPLRRMSISLRGTNNVWKWPPMLHFSKIKLCRGFRDLRAKSRLVAPAGWRKTQENSSKDIQVFNPIIFVPFIGDVHNAIYYRLRQLYIWMQ